MLALIEWSKDIGINIIVDESFVDFVDDIRGEYLLRQDILENNPHVCIVKSLSKCHAVPDLRLGIAASGNKKLISKLKTEISIWNINSFAEFYMQIEEKYKESYMVSLEKLKCERKRFMEELGMIPELRVIPSQANFQMVEIITGMTSKELTKRLLTNYNLLVKDLSGKISDGQFIRLAIRNTEDNDRLINALRKIFSLKKRKFI